MSNRALTIALLALPLALQAMPQRPRPGERPAIAELQRMQAEQLRQRLGITEEKAQALATRWAQMLKASGERARKVAPLRREFEEILQSPAPEEEKNARLKPLLEKFLAFRQQQQDLRRSFEEEVRAGLTPAQQARFILMSEDFQKNLHEGLREAQRGELRRNRSQRD